ncbi:hypothetical protein TPHA_0J00440 [Tetrapisispora phaffii CBS 4417]|uniref:Mid2 domain-containing protein n=1 Tax=Tetrapisispora phaffii (strain ATCC 24235 / CBS 4417 / NBRC 1672 / NRRL Y-8282 / UCD 70-5) TaxID=1071381 RepID=G8BYC5_TETPH|nr:hypothetical protein TPHA_0J00440 [Tetrapisispora phaffii CBS 4417]CCE64867.1 hypothetical protein TPHA_0J00440 [Tetrapisispora phaffii CBS 4417]
MNITALTLYLFQLVVLTIGLTSASSTSSTGSGTNTKNLPNLVSVRTTSTSESQTSTSSITSSTTTGSSSIYSSALYSSNSTTTSYSYSLGIPLTNHNKYISVPTDPEGTVYIAFGVILGVAFLLIILIWAILQFNSFRNTKAWDSDQDGNIHTMDLEKTFQNNINYNNVYSSSNLALTNSQDACSNSSGSPNTNSSVSDSNNSMSDNIDFESDMTEKVLREKMMENKFTLNARDTMFISPTELFTQTGKPYNFQAIPDNGSELNLQIEQTMISPIRDVSKTNSVYGNNFQNYSLSQTDFQSKPKKFRPPSMHLEDLLNNS